MVLGRIVAARHRRYATGIRRRRRRSTPSALVPIVPCRLMDTRPGADNVGPRATPLATRRDLHHPVWGTNGACTIPSTATAVAANVTSVNGTADSYLTLFPADADGSAVVEPELGPRLPADARTRSTSSSPIDGKLSMFNLAGSVDVIVDVVGYYVPVAERLRRQWRQGRPGDRPHRRQG